MRKTQNFLVLPLCKNYTGFQNRVNFLPTKCLLILTTLYDDHYYSLLTLTSYKIALQQLMRLRPLDIYIYFFLQIQLFYVALKTG